MEKYALKFFIAIILFLLISFSYGQTTEQGTVPAGGMLGNTADFSADKSLPPPQPQSGESILFLGAFGFDLDQNATSFRDFLLNQGYAITEVYQLATSAISASFLSQYTAVVFSDYPGTLTAAEAAAFNTYVNTNGGNLLLLGQMRGFSATDRDLVGNYFGIDFYDDLFCDPLSHSNYNGGCTGVPGDPDNGVEYVLLRSFADHPVTRNVSSFLLNWGQSLTLSGSAQAVATGSADSWSDLNAVYDFDPNCADGWYINTDDLRERHGNLPGIAVYESAGKVVAIGDNDMLWNFHFPGGEQTLMGNVFTWFFSPTLISPADGHYIVDTTPYFDWTDILGATSYDLQVDDNADFSSPLIESSRQFSWYNPEVGMPSGTYYWRVRAVNLDGTGAWSEVFSFSITRIPTLVSPANNSQITDNTPLCTWTNGLAFIYLFQLSTVSDFRTIVAQGSSSGNSYQVGTPLSPGVYYWRVALYGTTGEFGGRSSTFRFEVLPPEVNVTVTTSPSGLQVIVDGTNYTAPQTFSWQPGSQHSVSVTSPQAGGSGTRYVYDHWNDQGAQTHTITVPANGGTLTAYFNLQYYLNMIAGSGGTVSPGNGWYGVESTVQISASANNGYGFMQWSGLGSGSYSGTNNPATVSMNGPITETASFGRIVVNQPNGGEVLYVGTTYDIMWTEENISYVYIEYSTNGGQTWSPVASEITQNSYSWTVPNTPSNNCIVRVIENVYGNIYDISDDPFTISTGVPITVTASEDGMDVIVDGVTRAAPYTAQWIPGSQHTIGVTSPQDGGTGRRFVYDSWSDGGAQTHTITTPGSPTTYTANFNTEYFLEMVADDGGTVAPASAWYASGATVQVSATPDGDHYFTSWQGTGIGSYSGTDNSATVTMNSGIRQTAYFNPLIASTVTTSPAGRAIVVDGQSYTAPQTFLWQPGTPHSIGVTSPQSGGTGIQYVYANWSDGGAQTHDITAPAQSTTYTASFNTEYYLTMNAMAGGSVTPASGWRSAGENVQISATADGGYYFAGWNGTGSGSYNGGDNPATVTINGPINETGVFSALTNITVASFPAGLDIIVDGETFTAPHIFQWQESSQHTIGVASPQVVGSTTRYIYSNWSDGGGQTHTIVTPGTSETYTVNFDTEYYLEMVATTGGSVTPASAWRSASDDVQIAATADGGYYFSGWTGTGNGSYTGSDNPASVTMNGPVTQTANFSELIEINVITSPAGLDIIVDGENFTAPQTFNWTPGDIHDMDVNSPQEGATGIRYVFNSWSDAGSQMHQITTPAGAASYTASFDTEYYLMVEPGEYDEKFAGMVDTSGSGWYTALDSAEISVSPDTLRINIDNVDYEQFFTGWDPQIPGYPAGTPTVKVYMNEPKTVTATWSSMSITTIALETMEIPREFVLQQNYPNPFNPSTTIRYGLPRPAEVKIDVYNILGQQTSTVINEFKPAGYHTITFDGNNLAAGIYFIVFQSENYRAVKKMVLLK